MALDLREYPPFKVCNNFSSYAAPIYVNIEYVNGNYGTKEMQKKVISYVLAHKKCGF